MIGQTENELLAQTEEAIRSKVDPKYQAGLERAYTAGMGIAYSDGGSKLMQEQFAKEGDPLVNIAEGAVKLTGIVYEQSRQTMPIQIAVPLSMLFMCEGLDFSEKAGKLQVTNEVVAKTTQETGSMILQLFGVTPEKMQSLLAKSQSAVARSGSINAARTKGG